MACEIPHTLRWPLYCISRQAGHRKTSSTVPARMQESRRPNGVPVREAAREKQFFSPEHRTRRRNADGGSPAHHDTPAGCALQRGLTRVGPERPTFAHGRCAGEDSAEVRGALSFPKAPPAFCVLFRTRTFCLSSWKQGSRMNCGHLSSGPTIPKSVSTFLSSFCAGCAQTITAYPGLLPRWLPYRVLVIPGALLSTGGILCTRN